MRKSYTLMAKLAVFLQFLRLLTLKIHKNLFYTEGKADAMRFINANLIKTPLLAILLISPQFYNQAVAEDSNAKTAVGGGLGAAAGTAIGGVVGGSTGEIIGGAVGGGVGGAVTTHGEGKTGAVLGGAAGGATGAVVGRKVSGSGTGAVVGAGVGGAGGAVVGKVIAEPGKSSSNEYRHHKRHRRHHHDDDDNHDNGEHRGERHHDW